MDTFNLSSLSQVPVDASVVYALSPALVQFAQSHASPGQHPPEILDGLNQAIAKGDLIWQLGRTVVLGLGSEFILKAGNGIETSYIPTMNYIKERAPRVPLSEIQGVFQAKARTFVFMSRIKGESLNSIWTTLDATQKASIKEQLGPLFSDIRSVPPPPPPSDEPQAILGGGIPRRCKDARRHIREADCPISNEAEFNQFLTSNPRRAQTGWLAMIRFFLATDHKLVMSHGDVHPRNIMVTKCKSISQNSSTEDVTVTGLLDWEMCGYYPEYWEYVKALHTVAPGDGFDDWWFYLPSSIGEWPKEFAVDLMISWWKS